VIDYVQEQGRTYGINEESYYFGRSRPVEIQGEEEEKEESSFVYTASTLRVMEQICVALEMQESVLLVGETGTGKTTSVQELAKLQGKKLHVFNMN
jgi:midasin